MAEPVTLGVIVGVHGVRGLVRVKSFTEVPEDVAAYGPLQDAKGTRYEIDVTGKAKGVLLVRIDGVKDRTQAEALKGTELLIDRDLLPEADEDEFYHADLIGLAVEKVDGERLGTVAMVQNFGAGDLLEVQLDGSRKTVLLPFDEASVPEIDLATGRLVVDPPAGLLDDGEPEVDAG